MQGGCRGSSVHFIISIKDVTPKPQRRAARAEFTKPEPQKVDVTPKIRGGGKKQATLPPAPVPARRTRATAAAPKKKTVAPAPAVKRVEGSRGGGSKKAVVFSSDSSPSPPMSPRLLDATCLPAKSKAVIVDTGSGSDGSYQEYNDIGLTQEGEVQKKSVVEQYENCMDELESDKALHKPVTRSMMTWLVMATGSRVVVVGLIDAALPEDAIMVECSIQIDWKFG
jgi:hypothetical protein